MIRILVCDDQAIIRDGLEMLLKLEPDMTVVGKAGEGFEALRLIEEQSPDLVLMDLQMPGMNGIEAIRHISRRFLQVKVLVLTTYADDEWLFDALRAGASGYLLKDTPREDVVKAVRGTVAGKSYLDPSVAGKLVTQAVAPVTLASNLSAVLTSRELDVLHYLAQGLNNADIATTLFLSEGTVRNHVSGIISKLGVNDRTQAAVLAIRQGLGHPK